MRGNVCKRCIVILMLHESKAVHANCQLEHHAIRREQLEQAVGTHMELMLGLRLGPSWAVVLGETTRYRSLVDVHLIICICYPDTSQQ